jgi:hypothetical protein
MVLSIIFLEDKHKILLYLSILYEYQQFFQHLICFSIQPQLQLVNLHRNRRYFVIKLHSWFCLVRVQAPLNTSLYNLYDNPAIYSDYHINTQLNISMYLNIHTHVHVCMLKLTCNDLFQVYP